MDKMSFEELSLQFNVAAAMNIHKDGRTEKAIEQEKKREVELLRKTMVVHRNFEQSFIAMAAIHAIEGIIVAKMDAEDLSPGEDWVRERAQAMLTGAMMEDFNKTIEEFFSTDDDLTNEIDGTITEIKRDEREGLYDDFVYDMLHKDEKVDLAELPEWMLPMIGDAIIDGKEDWVKKISVPSLIEEFKRRLALAHYNTDAFDDVENAERVLKDLEALKPKPKPKRPLKPKAK